MERIDHELAAVELHLAEEMAGKADAVDAQAAAAADLHEDDAERQRNSRPPIEDFIEKAVARVVVVVAIPAVPELVEQVAVQASDLAFRARARRQTVLHACGQPIEQAQVMALVELGIFLARHSQ